MEPDTLSATRIIDSGHPSIVDHAKKTVAGRTDPVQRAIRIYYAVRDGIRYDPYHPFYLPEHYRASNILKWGKGYCVCKASLLCALGRALNIPSRLGFADVRNHLATKQLLEFMGTDLFVYHGFVEFFLEEKWVKATPAFNRELCERHRVAPLEFDGKKDSILHPYNLDKKQFMEYVADHGTYTDVPVETIVAAWKRAYGEARVQSWINALEKSGGSSIRDFYREEILTGQSYRVPIKTPD